MTQVVLREISKCSNAEQLSVREVRNQPSIRASMYTDHEIAVEEHTAWLGAVSNDPKQIVFVVLIEGAVSGVVSLTAIDRLHLKSDWAFYLGEKARGGLGAALEFKLIEFAFQDIGLEKLNCEVIETNDMVVKRHKTFGFAEEGYRRENVLKNGKRIGVYFLGLTRSDWDDCKSAVFAKYQDAIKSFAIEIEYEPAGSRV